ncbi:carboxypeptidase regulatory-like domain-containing protein [Paludisphaera rhizosphaerae]|uniref:carboxypeptidase regulatory-like domain-containing protein n=1 Tax=Paludisphaera rhizosphaerae TaxID=2711216 RepID=UPI0013EA202B|nr:carboxypeptidase regulatory-like domain-containing protein [Paludisphaera rhizosphaerae]
MRSRGYWSPLLAAALLAIGAGREASAYDVWVETVDWVPTSSVVSVPSYLATSYVVPTSFSVPTYYATAYVTETAADVIVPTSYVASSYVVPTYYETRFRRSLFGRRWIPTGTRAVYPTTYTTSSYFPTTLYYPSSYVVPTTFSSAPVVVDRGVVATAYTAPSTCCADSVIASPTSVRVVAPESPSIRRPAPSASAEDDLNEAPALPSNVQPPPAAPKSNRPAPVQSQPKAVLPEPGEIKGGEPPTPPAAERQQSTVRPSAEEPPAPTTPANSEEVSPAPGDLGLNTRREAMRPVYDPARSVDPARRNVLFGRVRSRDTGEVEEGVRIVVSSRTGVFEDRPAHTDAFGRFAVRVPDGDWTVRVTMPSGRIYAVSEITVDKGLIVDAEGRDVPSLTITR